MIDLTEIVPRPLPGGMVQPLWWHPEQTRACAIAAQLHGGEVTPIVSIQGHKAHQCIFCGWAGKLWEYRVRDG